MKKGFTLVELLVVVAIIGLLTGMVVISIKTVKAKARDSQRVSNITTIATSLALYGIPTDPLNRDNYRYYYQSTNGSDYYLEYYLETNSVSGKSQGLNYVIP